MERAASRAEVAGAAIDVVALAAVRATREAQVRCGREKLPSILGTPLAGEAANGETFDGNTEVATFPGDLPDRSQGPFQRKRRFPRAVDDRRWTRPISAFCAFAPRASKTKEPASRLCLISASTARFSS